MSTPPLNHNDYSQHQTTFGVYHNYGQHVAGTVNNVYAPSSNPLQSLKDRQSPSAAFDSSARFQPPRCTESTRLAIIQKIEEWIINDSSDAACPASVFWLYGGAGVGKSALCQTLAEKYKEEGELLASFFFFRSDTSRNDGNILLPTLILQLVNTFEGLAPFVEDAVSRHWDWYNKNYQFQIQELLVKPLWKLKERDSLLVDSVGPRLIIIDGLDECQDPDIQCNLLQVIAEAIVPQPVFQGVKSIPYPLRFLVASRPESRIMDTFNHDQNLKEIQCRYNLSKDPTADMDILKFLEKKFEEIRRTHCLAKYLPPDWPPRNALTTLVERSSGHFVYASTVIQYIKCPDNRPDDRLHSVLALDEGKPYEQLDTLYTLIFEAVKDPKRLSNIFLVLGIVFLHSQAYSGLFTQSSFSSNRGTIEMLLSMKDGDLILLVRPILSLISIDGDIIRILHKSLFDFLVDPTRRGSLPFDLARVHEVAANYIFTQKIRLKICTAEEFGTFAYHCRFGYLNNTLKKFLQSLEVPYTRHITATPKESPSSVETWNFSLSSMYFLLETLKREDFDSTGWFHEQHAAKWTQYLHSLVPQNSISLEMANLDSNAGCVKERVDALLSQWKPRNFNPTDVEEMISSHGVKSVASIEEEYNMHSSYAKALISPQDPKQIVSSLVIGEHFIHSYHFRIQQEPGNRKQFIMFFTYARHNNSHYEHMFVGFPYFFLPTRDYLMKAEKLLFSDLYQKHGITPDKS